MSRRDPLSVRTQNKRVRKKQQPQWDNSVGDVGAMKLNKTELDKRTKLYSAKHMEKIRSEIRDMQRKEKEVQNTLYSSPFTAHNQSIVLQSSTDTKSKLQNLLNETDRRMAQAKDLFGDCGYKYSVIPNVTSAPNKKNTSMFLDVPSDSPPTALNDTQKLGMVTVEKLPPDNRNVDLTRLRALLDREKENLTRQAVSTLQSAKKINKVLNFDESVSAMRDSRSRRVARLTEENPLVETGNMEEMEGVEGRLRSTSWSEVPVEQAKNVVVSSKPGSRDSSFEKSPNRIGESSSDSRLKRQQKGNKNGVETRGENGRSRSGSSGAGSTSPVHFSEEAPGARPNVLRIPVKGENRVKIVEESEESEDDPIRGSRSPSGLSPRPSPRCSPRPSRRAPRKDSSTSPLRAMSPKQTVNIATSPVRGIGQSPVRSPERRVPLQIERMKNDERPFTDQQLKDRLEHLITGGNYPFAKIQQKSYAITEGSSVPERPGQAWVRSGAPSQGPEEMAFTDNSPLKNAALELELKLRKYQSQIGVSPARRQTTSGYSGYTSLLLQSVSTMIGYLTEQGGSCQEEGRMMEDVINTMSALQNTVETLSTELLSCRRDLSATKQKVQSLESQYNTTLSFLLENCLLKEGVEGGSGPGLPTPLPASKVSTKQLPTVISPFTTTTHPSSTSSAPTSSNSTTTPHSSKYSDLIQFTPHNLIEFTPSQPPKTDTLVQISPQEPSGKNPVSVLEQTALNVARNIPQNTAAVTTGSNSEISKIVDISRESVKEDESTFNLTGMSLSHYSDDGLDLSQDLDALIERLRHMNAQTLAVSAQALTPRKPAVDAAAGNVGNIKEMLSLRTSGPSAEATAVIEAYNKPSEFSPSQLLPQAEEDPAKPSTQVSRDLEKVYNSGTVTPPATRTNRDIGNRVSGEKPGSTGRSNSPGKMHRSGPSQDTTNISDMSTIDLSLIDSTHDSSLIACLSNGSLGSPGWDRSGLSRTSSYQSSFTAASRQSEEPSAPEMLPVVQSPQSFSTPDRSVLINQFLAQNPHYLQKMSEGLASKSLPSLVSSNGDGEKKTTEVKPIVPNSGPEVVESVLRGSVYKNIAKFERKQEEMSPRKDTSPRRSPRRAPGRNSPTKSVSPDRGRRARRNVSWDEQLLSEEPTVEVKQPVSQPVSKPAADPHKNGSSTGADGDLMAQLLNLNDAKLTELVTTLNKLTER